MKTTVRSIDTNGYVRYVRPCTSTKDVINVGNDDCGEDLVVPRGTFDVGDIVTVTEKVVVSKGRKPLHESWRAIDPVKLREFARENAPRLLAAYAAGSTPEAG